MFGFNFQKRKERALALFTQALSDLQRLNDDTQWRIGVLESEEAMLREAADDVKAEAEGLEKDRQAVLTTISRIRGLLA
jgi:hypothetical protein